MLYCANLTPGEPQSLTLYVQSYLFLGHQCGTGTTGVAGHVVIESSSTLVDSRTLWAFELLADSLTAHIVVGHPSHTATLELTLLFE